MSPAEKLARLLEDLAMQIRAHETEVSALIVAGTYKLESLARWLEERNK